MALFPTSGFAGPSSLSTFLSLDNSVSPIGGGLDVEGIFSSGGGHFPAGKAALCELKRKALHGVEEPFTIDLGFWTDLAGSGGGDGSSLLVPWSGDFILSILESGTVSF